MPSEMETPVISAFAQDVREGLSKPKKTLPSKYFYDDKGSKLFEQIMDLPEYYVTNSEFEVFTQHSEAIIKQLAEGAQGIQLIELGAGNGLKTKLLLQAVQNQGLKATYTPIDISEEAIQNLMGNLKHEFPSIPFQPIVADYFEALESLEAKTGMRKVVMFLGSTIGNFTWEESVGLLKHIVKPLQEGDRMLIGFDQKKDPRTIRAAYDDAQKVTKEFNMNLLRRINRELEGNFDLSQFDHYASYSPETGEARSYLISLADQEVSIGALEEEFHFDKWECVHTEISRKYDRQSMKRLSSEVGCQPLATFKDEKDYFANAIWEL